MSVSQLAPSELTLNSEGKLYHLNVGNKDVAPNIILVGDQNRVAMVAEHFDSISYQTQHREFATTTGKYNGVPITVTSHGIGCDNIDIVLTELDAAINIDLETRMVNPKLRSLKLIRIGTCGALQEGIEVGSAVISKYAIGLDGVANFYSRSISDSETKGIAAFKTKTNWPNDLVVPYLVEANSKLVDLLADLGTVGITVTANGFYGPQGRAIRLPLKYDDLKDRIRSFDWKGTPVTNLEMETSALLSLGKALGHEATTICLVLANRYNNTFASDFDYKMKGLISKVLDRMASIG